MTTRVHVDAHAGWPVEVSTIHDPPGLPQTINITVVKPYTARDFFVHSGFEIRVRELSDQWQPRSADPAPVSDPVTA